MRRATLSYTISRAYRAAPLSPVLNETTRERLEAAIESLIGLLDALDAPGEDLELCPDLEEDGDAELWTQPLHLRGGAHA